MKPEASINKTLNFVKYTQLRLSFFCCKINKLNFSLLFSIFTDIKQVLFFVIDLESTIHNILVLDTITK